VGNRGAAIESSCASRWRATVTRHLWIDPPFPPMRTDPSQMRAPQANAPIVVRTDAKGLITEVNRAFTQLTGFRADQILGQPIALLRHPDSPPALFADLWATLQAGRPWVGLIKNRDAHGQPFWVEAQLTPAFEDGGVLAGYYALYRQPSAAAIDDAERVFGLFREGRVRDLIFVRGTPVRDRLLHRINPLWNMSLKVRLILFSLFAPSLAITVAGVLLLGLPLWLAGATIGLGAIVSLYSGQWLGADLTGRLSAAKKVFGNIASGRYDDVIDVKRSDEAGSVLLGLKMMQIRLGVHVEALQTRAEEMERIRQGLDAAATALPLTDADLRITYANRALLQLFEHASGELREIWPELRADAVVGTSIQNLRVVDGSADDRSRFFKDIQRTSFSELKAGSRIFSLIVTPVNLDSGPRLGYVVEWRDRTDAVEVEREINAIVSAAAEGDFSRRIALRKSGRNDFFIQLVEGFNRVLDINTRALDEVVTVIDGLAEGDLTRTIAGDYRGTLAKIQADVNRTVMRLNEIVGRIRGATEAIDRGTREIAGMSTTITERTSQQADTLGDTATEIRRVTDSVKRNADNAGQARRLADTAVTVAERGGSAVEDVVTTMNSINQLSRKVADITGVIDGIAFQTNILALNSAVEAARAGEHGRGFAVVASEVRSLAQRAAGAAKEIKQLIDSSVEQIGKGSQLVEVAGGTMREIVDSVRQVTGLIRDIAEASEQQSQGIEQVSHAVGDVESTNRSSLALVEDAAHSAQRLEQAASTLSEAVSIFRTEDRRGADQPVVQRPASATGRR